jgi:Haem-NO-binding
MHGIVLTELQEFVTRHHGLPAWREVQRRAGLPPKVYIPAATYPDGDVVALVGAASALTGTPVPDLLEAFGAGLVPGLLQIYGRMVKKGWKTLDLLEHTESAMHTVVRRQTPGADPPQLSCVRTDPDRVVIVYKSSRRMCAVAKGIIRGVAAHFGDRVAISETDCMLKGDPQCTIGVQLVRTGPQPRSGSEARFKPGHPAV